MREGETVEWLDWVFDLKTPTCRHLLEFVESWNATRVVIAASIPMLLSTLTGIFWSVKSGDAQSAFAVAGFILTLGTGKFTVDGNCLLVLIIYLAFLALLAIVSSTEY